jgi:capsular exopolysaccharide synthesis family protein
MENSVLGLFGGMFLGMAFAIMRERTDRTIHQPGDAGTCLGVAELGYLPTAITKDSYPAELTALHREPSPMSESLRATLASILFAGLNGGRPRVLALASAGPREGKTTLAANLAIAVAGIGRRVLLIDADLRRPRLHQIFEFENGRGLADLLRSADPISDSLNHGSRATGVPNLTLITSGAAGEGDSDLLHSPRLKELLETACHDYDMVLIDTPPILSVADGRVVARQADAVVMVARANQTSRDSLRSACQRLAEDGALVLGAVLNDWNPKKGERQGYY